MNSDNTLTTTRLLPTDALASTEDDPTTDDEANAGIYARTSSNSQRFGYSIDEQVRRCWEQCESVGWNVRYVFTDEAKSGRNTDRPKFQTMLEKAEQGLLDVVVFWKLDRFCRSLVDLVKTAEQLEEWGVALQSVTEYIDTTSPVGRFNFRNLASAAELETDLTGQRVQMGMYGLAQDGKWPNDYPPLGYDKSADGTLEVNEREAELVERIFQLYLEERSMPQVAFHINTDEIRTKRGESWCRQSVKKVLSNELYIGTYQVADYESHIESYRLISDDLFEEATATRYRFKNAKGKMGEHRKLSKAERILDRYKNPEENTA